MQGTQCDLGAAVPATGSDATAHVDDAELDVDDALNVLCARALQLDAERERVCEREDDITRYAEPSELIGLERRRIEIMAEIEGLRLRIATLRRQADPGLP